MPDSDLIHQLDAWTAGRARRFPWKLQAEPGQGTALVFQIESPYRVTLGVKSGYVVMTVLSGAKADARSENRLCGMAEELDTILNRVVRAIAAQVDESIYRFKLPRAGLFNDLLLRMGSSLSAKQVWVKAGQNYVRLAEKSFVNGDYETAKRQYGAALKVFTPVGMTDDSALSLYWIARCDEHSRMVSAASQSFRAFLAADASGALDEQRSDAAARLLELDKTASDSQTVS